MTDQTKERLMKLNARILKDHRAGKSPDWWEDVKLPKKTPTEQLILEIERYVTSTVPSDFYLETMEDITRVLQKRYGKRKTVCPALAEILQIKMF